ncbi:MAG TPA: YicC/YloC family endoribonuclease, partial [Geobacteraceae bacterium]|nr:YicC/YloC family endoribonuclease [Geobacteraceae bacterium]
MTRSMTGYGKAEVTGGEGKFVVEIRSVNHRYGEVSVKLPRQMLFLEGDIRRRVSERFKRGKIDIFIQFEPAAGNVTPPVANIPLALAYNEAFSQIRQALGVYEHVPFDLILAQKDVLTVATQEATVDLEAQSADLHAALTAALDSME